MEELPNEPKKLEAFIKRIGPKCYGDCNYYQMSFKEELAKLYINIKDKKLASTICRQLAVACDSTYITHVTPTSLKNVADTIISVQHHPYVALKLTYDFYSIINNCTNNRREEDAVRLSLAYQFKKYGGELDYVPIEKIKELLNKQKK